MVGLGVGDRWRELWEGDTVPADGGMTGLSEPAGGTVRVDVWLMLDETLGDENVLRGLSAGPYDEDVTEAREGSRFGGFG